MFSFLFTALNHQGKMVTEKVAAENLSQAKYDLQLRGYSDIVFYQSELSADVLNTFDDKVIKKEQKNSEKVLNLNVQTQYDTRYWKTIFELFKILWVYWLIIIGTTVFVPNYFTFGLLAFSLVMFFLITVPVIISNKMFAAYFSHENAKAKFWFKVFRVINVVNPGKLPQFLIDAYIAKIEAREGKTQGLQQIFKYQNHPKVSKRMFNCQITSFYESSRQYDEMLKSLENSLQEGNVFQEEMLDYSYCLIRRHQKTNLARQVLDKLYDFELTVMNRPLLPLCKGVLELEEGNLSQAEFYLKRAAEELKPLEKNEYLVGVKSELKAFLALVLAKTGRKEEAAKLFNESKKYLEAAKERDLLERCEQSLN